MNLTLSLLTGLLLLVPGLTAVVVWNGRGARAGARRPDLPLTAVSALFAAIAISAVMHLLGYLLGEIAVRATAELGLRSDFTAPYPAIVRLLIADHPIADMSAMAEFAVAVAIESLAAWRLVTSEGLDLALHDVDARGQGWVFEHIVRPHMSGYVPIAYVLTDATHDGMGIGYQGSVAEVRQGEDGKVALLALGSPQRFLYVLRPGSEPSRWFGGARSEATIEIKARQWLGGVVALDGATIRNIVVHNLSHAELEVRRQAQSTT
jgi:hypothetical protein